MKMKKYIPKILIVVLSMILMVSCRDLTEVNDNPNAVEPDKADPNILITTVIAKTSRMYLDNFGYGRFAGVVQHCQKDAWFSDFNDFDWDASSWDGQFEILRTNELLLNLTADNEYYSFHHGVGLVMKAFLYGLITDMWGDVPYTDALQGNGDVLTPKYDTQKEVYLTVLELLEEAIPYFKSSSALEKNADILYNGDLEKWKKFAGSLMLRYYMRVSNKMPSFASAGFAAVVNSGNYIQSIDEDAAMEFPGNNIGDSWPYNTVYDDTGGSNFRRIKACKTFVDTLKYFNDPRIDNWFSKVKYPTKLSDTVTVDGAFHKIGGQLVRLYNTNSVYASQVDTSSDYVGLPPNLIIPESYNVNDSMQYQTSVNPFVSFLNDKFAEPKGDILKARLITYSEVSFLLAEASLKNWISGDVKTFYDNGIRVSIEMWDAADGVDIDDWINNQEGVTWGTGVWENELEQLIFQKWVASWTYETEAWLDALRTGYPKFTFGPGAKRAHLPYRYMYGSDEVSYNRANYDEAVERLRETDYSIKGKDDNWSKPWLYQDGIDEP